MYKNIKKVFFMSAVASLIFNSTATADFVENLTVSDTFNTNITSLVNNYSDNFNTGGVLSTLFGNEALSSFWQQTSNWTGGTLEMCYDYRPSNSINITPNICGLFSNVNVNTDPCALLPNTLGDYVKKSSSHSSSIQAPFKDWCKKIMGSGNIEKQELNIVSNQATLSGKPAPSLVLNAGSNNFNSEAYKQEQRSVDDLLVQYENRNMNSKTLGNAANRLNATGKGYIYKSYMDQMSKKANNLTPNTDMTANNNLIIPYQNIKNIMLMLIMLRTQLIRSRSNLILQNI